MKERSLSRKPVVLSESTQRRLGMYALAASAAGVSVLAFSAPGEGKIVYTKAHVVLGAGSNISHKLDLNHDGIVDFLLDHGFVSYSSSRNQFFSSKVVVPLYTLANQLNGVATSGVSSALALRAGMKIGHADKFRSEGLMASANGRPHRPPSNYSGAWADGGKGVQHRYLGFRFVIKDKLHYGWARLNISKWPFVATLTGYAYETVPNKAIIAGKTTGPDVVTVQPATLGHMARGSAAAKWRTVR